ncbi:MAG: hypothetical protein OJF51_000860 [Nitrospira sp.]|jgi:hypothetical protein|nr:MAG: hypothetical protein OJF51_000860 [Nitrospira sp.]
MKFYTFEIVVEKKQEDEGYSAYIVRLFPDALATGRPSKKPSGTSVRRYSNISLPLWLMTSLFLRTKSLSMSRS